MCFCWIFWKKTKIPADISRKRYFGYIPKRIFLHIFCRYIRKKYILDGYIPGYNQFLDILKDISRIYPKYPDISVDIFFTFLK